LVPKSSVAELTKTWEEFPTAEIEKGQWHWQLRVCDLGRGDGGLTSSRRLPRGQRGRRSASGTSVLSKDHEVFSEKEAAVQKAAMNRSSGSSAPGSIARELERGREKLDA
jgi:hypothetical protein